MEKSEDLAILLYSCWKNSDMWKIFLTLFRKYWSDCNYQLILLTDDFHATREEYPFDEIVVCDSNWHDMIMEGIRKANTEFVMLWMDDYLLCDYVNNEDMDKYIEKARQHHAANIRFVESDMIPTYVFSKDKEFNYYKSGTAYSFTTQIGIWSVECLKQYVKKDWSAWDFERKGSIEIKDLQHPLLGTRSYTFPYEEGVRKGKWMDNGIRVCKRNNIYIDFSKRKPMSNFELAWIYFKGGILSLNPTLVVKIQNMLQFKKK